jgi:hypothetical protein
VSVKQQGEKYNILLGFCGFVGLVVNNTLVGSKGHSSHGLNGGWGEGGEGFTEITYLQIPVNMCRSIAYHRQRETSENFASALSRNTLPSATLHLPRIYIGFWKKGEPLDCNIPPPPAGGCGRPAGPTRPWRAAQGASLSTAETGRSVGPGGRLRRPCRT